LKKITLLLAYLKIVLLFEISKCYDYFCNNKSYFWKVVMEKNKIKGLCLIFLLSLSTQISSCTTSYGVGGEIQLCIDDNEDETPYSLYDEENENDAWMELFHEGEDYEV